jgi:hypothetical protein
LDDLFVISSRETCDSCNFSPELTHPCTLSPVFLESSYRINMNMLIPPIPSYIW